jgi:alpha,alpha-trehalose phosphorylase
VIEPGVFPVEPRAVTEPSLRLDRLAHTETIFALSNGHIGLRGNLDEGEPHVVPGTYLNGFFESLPLPYAERGYGYPEEGQSLINVTNGKLFRLLIDDEPFDVRYGTLVRHERVLDLRDGVLRRQVEWASPTGEGGPDPFHSPGLVRPACRGGDPLRGRGGGPAGPHRRAIDPRRQ